MSARPPRSALVHAIETQAPPRNFDRRGRLGMVAEVARGLRDGRMPSDEARLFVASAVLAYLQDGGDLARDYFKLTRPKSHMTIQRLWRELEDERLAQASSAMSDKSRDRL